MMSRIPIATLLAASLLLLCQVTSPVYGQIFNGETIIAVPTGSNFVTTDILPSFLPDTSKLTSTDGSKTSGGSTTAPPAPSSAPTTPPLPASIQPYTTMASEAAPAPVVTPLPLPTAPAMFPQNVSSCSTCYGMFPTLSRCNVIANTDTFPITASTTIPSLLPFLKCICTYKALDAYPYCIDCFTKTKQPDQLNVLQANHLENYMDALQQMCGATYNGNKALDARSAAEQLRSGLLGSVVSTEAFMGFLLGVYVAL
ncbi:hypothetical protein B0O80DRAFT_421089 [Mortierella sp. GBAus27b]|nr:hypothetical protein B0O80DRAFT_421089 [Mortierella sp. GBAus27b]